MIELLSTGLWLAAAAHIFVLLAGLGAVRVLGWKEDIPKLTEFNQRVFWTYAVYIGASNAAFGAMTFFLHDEMIAGDKAALTIAAFIGIWWTARFLLDIFHYGGHELWPKGPLYKVAHVGMLLLFFALSAAYDGIVFYHLV